MKDVNQMTAEEVEAEVVRGVADYPVPEARDYDGPGLPPGARPLPGCDLLCTLHRLLEYGVSGNGNNDADNFE